MANIDTSLWRYPDFNPALVLLLVMLVVYVWSIIWVYKDAKKRGKPPLIAALLVALLSWPVSLLLWLLFRPSQKH